MAATIIEPNLKPFDQVPVDPIALDLIENGLVAAREQMDALRQIVDAQRQIVVRLDGNDRHSPVGAPEHRGQRVQTRIDELS